jgi:branched-chain amino acid transport system permease protein
MIELLQTTISGALTGLVYGLVALSFIVIYRAARIVNLAQGELIVLGGFLIWSFVAALHLPLALGVPAALGASAACGLLLERALFRPLVGQSSFTIVMATIALLILLRGLEQAVWGAETRPYPEVLPRGAWHIGPFLLNRALLIGALGTLLLTEALNWWFLRTRAGLCLAAVAEDHFTALSLGISVKRATTIAWVLGSVLACLASVVLLSGRLLSVSAAEIGFVALPVAMLGGLESVRGAPLAGLLVGIGEALASAYLDPLTNGAASRLFPFVLMVGVLLFRPQGLFGWHVIERI